MVAVLKKIMEISISSNVLYIVVIFAIVLFTLKYYAKSKPFMEQRKLRSARQLLLLTAMLLSSVSLAFYYKEYRNAIQYAYEGYEEKLNTEQAKKEVATIANTLAEKKEREQTTFNPIQPKEENNNMLTETTEKVITYFSPKTNIAKSDSKYNVVTKKTTIKNENTKDYTHPSTDVPIVQDNVKEKEQGKEDSNEDESESLVVENNDINNDNNIEDNPNSPIDTPTVEQKPIEENNENSNEVDTERDTDTTTDTDTEIIQAVALFQQEINKNNIIPLRKVIQSIEKSEEETFLLTNIQSNELKRLYNEYQTELKDIYSIHGKKRITPYVQDFDIKITSLYQLLMSKSIYSITEYHYIIQLYAESEYLLYHI